MPCVAEQLQCKACGENICIQCAFRCKEAFEGATMALGTITENAVAATKGKNFRTSKTWLHKLDRESTI